MSDKLLEEYKAYYATRAEKYAGNPNFPNYSAAEKRLSDAMQSCSALDEFKDKIGDLNERCASALIKDQYTLEQKHFEKHQEPIRAMLSKRILEKVDVINNVNDLITMVTEEANKNMIEIALDEANRFFIYEWEYADMAEVYAHAEVPDKYKADMQRWATEVRTSIAEGAKNLETQMHAFKKDWKINPEVIKEYRHRRLLPFTDDQIAEQLERLKKIINS